MKNDGMENKGYPIKKIFYCCYGGAHSSVVAAAIHSGQLPRDRVPEPKRFVHIGGFDEATSEDWGRLFLMGTDRWNNEIYFLGLGPNRELGWRLMRSLFQLYGVSKEDYKIIGTLEQINFLVRIGGFLSRRLGLVFLGRILLIAGLRRCYTEFVELVEDVEEQVKP